MRVIKIKYKNSFWLKIVSVVFIAANSVVGTSNVLAQNSGHPLITAFEGSQIESQEVKEFDEQQLVLGKVQQDGTVKTQKLEGKITKIKKVS